MSGINDGGKRITYENGDAIREPSDGKGRFDLITPYGLRRLAIWYELGAKKYSDRNWEKGMPFSRYLDSALRHLNKFTMGMDDEDHLAAACWNILSIMHHQERGELELDDLPHYETVDRKRDNKKVAEILKKYAEEGGEPPDPVEDPVVIAAKNFIEHFKGSVKNYCDLPQKGASVGDIYTVTSLPITSYTWIGTKWVETKWADPKFSL